MSKLNLRSGRLWRSLSPNAPAGDSKRTFKIDEFGGFKFEIESLLPYAKIQDTGGFIKATPTGGFMKYKMAWFMWFLHQKTNNVFWLKNAWAVRRDGVSLSTVFTKINSVFRGNDSISPSKY